MLLVVDRGHARSLTSREVYECNCGLLVWRKLSNHLNQVLNGVFEVPNHRALVKGHALRQARNGEATRDFREKAFDRSGWLQEWLDAAKELSRLVAEPEMVV